MQNQLTENHDQVPDPIVTPDGLQSDAAPNNTPADPTEQPIESAPPEATGTPDATPESSETQPTDVPAADTPEAPAPPKTKQPRAKRPVKPGREKSLLKGDRSGIGGPKTEEGKAVSCLNNVKHGMYSRMPFYLLPYESQEEYDNLLDCMRTQFPPIDESTAQMLEMHVQAFYRIRRCNLAEYRVEDDEKLDTVQKGRARGRVAFPSGGEQQTPRLFVGYRYGDQTVNTIFRAALENIQE